MSVGGPYRLVRTVASGGMAQVIEAVLEGTGGFRRRVAIKRILPEFAQEESFRRMFLDEARIASHLHHANVVQVLDYGVVDGAEFIAFEFVDGIDAWRAARVGQGQGDPMPDHVALHIVSETAHALEHAHTRTDTDGAPLHIVHRDVSPGNILLSWDGDVKLSDFGIAVAESREERTKTGVVKGKLAYMSPEQAVGAKVTSASDVYSLGATLHALLVGAPPDRSAAGTGDACAALPADVGELVTRCLASEPGARPRAAAVAEVAARLAQARRSQSARAELREWLARGRPKAPQVAHAFDRMLGLCMVQREGDAREYTLAEDRHDHATAEAPTVAAVAAEPPPGGGPAPAARSASPGDVSEAAAAAERTAGLGRARAIGLAVAGVAVLGLAVLGLALGGDRAPAAVSSAEAGSRQARATPPQPADDATRHGGAPLASSRDDTRTPGSVGGATGEPTDASAPGNVAVTGAREVLRAEREAEPTVRAPVDGARGAVPRRGGAPPPAPPATAEVAPEPVEPPAAASAPALGWLQVGGASLLRGAIEIDGRVVRHAPALLELATGEHRLRVLAEGTGAALVDERVTISSEHRRASPLRVVR